MLRGAGGAARRYEDQGKYLTKMNTFTDFCDCAEHLVRAGWCTASRLAIEGRSAGGLLMGAVLNLRPDLFKVRGAPPPGRARAAFLQARLALIQGQILHSPRIILAGGVRRNVPHG